MAEIGHMSKRREKLMKQMTGAVRHYHLIMIYQNFSTKTEVVGSYETSVNF